MRDEQRNGKQRSAAAWRPRPARSTGAAISPQRPPVSRWIMSQRQAAEQDLRPEREADAASRRRRCFGSKHGGDDQQHRRPCRRRRTRRPPIDAAMIAARSSDVLRGIGHLGDGGAARQLQRADIGDDRPAVVRLDARRRRRYITP